MRGFAKSVFVFIFTSILIYSQLLQATTAADCKIGSLPHENLCINVYSSLHRFVQWPSVYLPNGSSVTNFTLVCYYPPSGGNPENRIYAWECYANSPGRVGPENPPPPRCPIQGQGSTIRYEEGSVAEEVHVVGTPFQLVYTSERVIGNSKAYKLPLVAGANSSIYYSGVDFRIIYDGTHHADYSLSSHQSQIFTWNGKNASGVYTESPMDVLVISTERYNTVEPVLPVPIENTFSLGTWNLLQMGMGGGGISMFTIDMQEIKFI